MNPVKSIVRSATLTTKDKLNIVTCQFDGKFETMLAKTGHNFFLIPVAPKWPWEFASVPKPRNFKILADGNLPIDLTVDCVICNDRRIQYQGCAGLAHMLHVPLIIVDHCIPHNVRAQDIGPMQASQPCAASIAVTPAIGEVWNSQLVIPYEIDIPTEPKDYQNSNVLACGTYSNVDVNALAQMIAGIPNVRVVGNNPPLSRPARSPMEMSDYYKHHSIYINLAAENRIPISLLDAMANGCAVLSNPIHGFDLLQDGKNALVSNSVNELRSKLIALQANVNLREALGRAARETMIQNYPQGEFVRGWESVFETVTNTIYHR